MSDKIKTVIALGYFDSVHKGHRLIIETAKAKAKKIGSVATVFTFDGNLNYYIGKGDKKYLFSKEERKKIFDSIGANQVFFAPVNKEFLSLTAKEFLDFINAIYDIKAYVCGSDYRFGNGGEGNVDFLKSYAAKNGQEVLIEPFIIEDGEKISTSKIKELLKRGNVKKANSLLGFDYFIDGKVFKDRMVGRKIGFPTVNLEIKEDKSPLKNGVYAGYVLLDKKYKAIINYGARPTFDLNKKLIEAHILDFDGELYGKDITVSFTDYMRDIIKFSDKEALAERLKKDLEELKGRKYD